MSVEKRVLCSASRYTKKYYLNPEFDRLPTAVKDELKIMCVLFTEEVGGVILLMFDEDGNLGYNGVTLEWWPELDSQERIVVTRVFEGDMPDLSIGFIAEDETRYEFAVTISGADGAPQLLEVPAGEG